MDFACLRCRAHVRVALGANGRELAERQAPARRDSGTAARLTTETRETKATVAGDGERDRAQEQDQGEKKAGDARSDAVEDEAATRCCRCDGLYHTKCVVEAGAATLAFECAACLRGDSSEDGSGDDGSSPALLLPLAALGLVEGKAIAPATIVDEEEDEEDDWVVFNESIDVCAACRQVHIEPADRAPCEQCHADGRVHRRCLEAGVESKTTSPPTASSPMLNRSPGRKRKRSSSASASVPSSGALAACSSCQAEAPCAIESRRLALLMPKGDREWWEVCATCRRDFCLHALVDDGDVEEDVLRSRCGRDLPSGFQCQACSERVLEDVTTSVTESSIAFCDQSTLPPVEGMFGVDPLMEEEGTVLLCDGCEGEFEMAKLDPPLLEVPEGDWFCASCKMTRNEQHHEDLDGDAQLVTLLICDGCENEFDMAAIQPPVVAIPEGDWYCSSCVAHQDAVEGGSQMSANHTDTAVTGAQFTDEVSGADAEPTIVDPVCTMTTVPDTAVMLPQMSTSEDTSSPTTATVTGVSEMSADGVTLIECDGCDDKYDVATIRPAAPEVPKGDWFCDTCEATRKRRKKGYVAMKMEKARRLKAMGLGDNTSSVAKISTPKPVIPRIQPEPRVRVEPRRSANLGLPPPTTVTLLICDGCEGEYDMAMLNPPLSSVPRGDWFCSTCVGARRKSPSMMPCETCGTPVRWNRDAQRAARRRGDTAVLCEPCVIAKAKIRVLPPADEVVRDDKKRKRASESTVQHDGRMQVDPVERIFSPVPVSVSFSSVAVSNGSGSSTSANALPTAISGHVVCSEDEGDGISDHDDDHIIIVCEICLSEFNMIDVLGESKSLAPPPRPWYCMPCVRRLKKNRKKKQRISKQMMLEMQLYGGLLRPTAAKAVDPLVRALHGKKPSSEDEMLSLSTLVGTRVGVMLSWDKHWVMGRILSFDMASGTHLIRFDDESEQVLPLFAFPFVIGTAEIIEVRVPASRNLWWPAQVLKTNAIAERQFLGTVEDPEVLKSLRLVSLFSPESRSMSLESVACWAPRHLCRAFLKRTNPSDGSEDDDYRLAVIRASNEVTTEARVRASALRTLLRVAEGSGGDVLCPVANALVGCKLAWENKEVCTIKDFDASTRLHRVQSDSGHEEQTNLFQSSEKFALEGTEMLGRLQLVLYKALRGIESVSTQDSKQDSEPLDVQLTILPSSTSIQSSPASSSGRCEKCYLPAIVDGETGAFSGEKTLVPCIKCAKAFHSYCCDPPHGKFPLVDREDGSILVEDIKSGFVCRECVTCAGCNTSSSSRWFQWRLPLRVVSLCGDCITVYDNKCQCAVCNIALDDGLLDNSAALLKCSSCDLWVHPHCEPDPHPAFRRRTQQDGLEFELDLRVPLPDLSVKDNDHEDEGDDEIVAGKSTGTNGTAVSRSARLADEERAFELHFKESYDARVFNNYECLSCRKLRLLRVLHRLRLEDKLDLFKEPVTKLIAPTYFDVIKQPMDLATMQQKILANVYKRVNFRDFRDDFELLCLNAVTFNSRDRDFLIWREAWRFYGQGQKILRQIAPKTRMKRRGGKHYDALVFAAKRQLPNNSQLGKTKLGAGSDGDDDDGDDDDEEEEEDPENVSTETEQRDDAEREAGSEHNIQDGMSVILDQHTNTVPASGVESNEVSEGTTKSEPNRVPSTESLVSSSKSALEKKRALNGIVSVSFTPQSELGLAPKPHSVLQFYLTMHSRSGAHTYCWVDACGICGTRGSRDDDLLFCVDCGEGFHTFCCGVDETKFLSAEHPIHTYWRCANCEMCELCGKPHDKEMEEEEENRRMQCNNCDRSFHGKCLLPAIQSDHDFDHPDDTRGSGELSQGDSFYCSNCVTCKCCNKTQPRASYSNNREMCLSCSQSQRSEQSLMSAKTKDLLQVWAADTRRQRKDAEKCPMCRNKWTTEDADLIQCDACECWAHPRCDPVFVEDPAKYQDLVNDPNAQYVCSACRSHERAHLHATPNLAKCQLFLAKIQRTRSLCDARWVEARAQMRQAQVWNEWKDNLAIYLYVLRIGEECLKNLAYRSVNFQEDWTRRSAKNQDISLPSWLFQKAARYLRYKRYARGPRAAARKLTRKAENFYSQQGLDKQKEPHAIATVASQASSCAALIVCVHWLYGWAPLQRVVFHLLEREDDHLSQSLVKSLLVDNNETLEDEIDKIKKQYERRAGKKHLLRLQAEDGEGDDCVVDEEISPTGSSVSSMGPDFSGGDSRVATPEAAKVLSTAGDMDVGTSSTCQVVQVKRPSIHMTRAHPLGATRGIASTTPLSGSPPTVEDNRYCSLCFIVGDNPACGRLVYVELDQWVHMNCALWSSEVYEDASGVLQRCQKALSRSKTNRCDGCGVLGATLGCCVSRCPRHYHLPCALDRGVVFLPNGETCCPMPSHVQQVTKKLQLQDPLSFAPESSQQQHDVPVDNLADDAEPVDQLPDEDALVEKSDTTSAAAVETTAPPPQWSPLVKEPRHCVRVDFSSIFSDTKKRMNALHLKRQVCFRIGALTVHSLGHVVIGNPSFYSRDAVYPLGFRSTRVYWSTRHLAVRCVYECVVTSTDVESRKHTNDKDAQEQRFSSPKALFKITASDDKENPIVAASPTEALLELRSRVVSLYEEARCFASAEANPFLNRRSWFSYGLLGHQFFGFGIPEIAREIESLPHVATTAIRRRYILYRHRQQQNQRKRRRGQEVLVDDEEAKVGDHVYVFSHRLPPAAEMALAMREVEQVVEAEEHARMSSGAVRTDGLDRQVDEEEEAALRATRRRLNKDATRDSHVQLPLEKAAQPTASATSGAATDAGGDPSAVTAKEKQAGVPMDLEHLPIAMQYRELRRRPFSERLEVLKSKIHGYGLFTKEKFVEGQMIVEYQGQMISQAVADVREKQYEEMGIGSCYMFRLDEKTIIDATRCGNLARFMNHSCDPKAFARVVVVENNEKKIVIFAKRTIEAFEEVTYDYKFPIEDEAIRCDCGAFNCIGRMN